MPYICKEIAILFPELFHTHCFIISWLCAYEIEGTGYYPVYKWGSTLSFAVSIDSDYGGKMSLKAAEKVRVSFTFETKEFVYPRMLL